MKWLSCLYNIYMSERLDRYLRYLIIILPLVFIYPYFGFVETTAPLFSILADGLDITIGHYPKNYQWILLALLVVFRFVLFGKTYQR